MIVHLVVSKKLSRFTAVHEVTNSCPGGGARISFEDECKTNLEYVGSHARLRVAGGQNFFQRPCR